MIPIKATSFFIILFVVFLSKGYSQVSTATNETLDLEGMVHQYGKKKYNTFSGKWSFKDEATWILFKNGWALKNPDRPISEIDISRSKAQYPDHWKKWIDDEKFKEVKILEPSPKNARYDLSVKLYSVGGTPISSSVSTKKFTLFKNGKFETSVFALAEISAGNSSSRVTKAKDKSGSQGSASGDTENGAGKISTTKIGSNDSDGSMTGSYLINGHTITLSFDSGEKKTLIFATDGKGEMILGRDFYFN